MTKLLKFVPWIIYSLFFSLSVHCGCSWTLAQNSSWGGGRELTPCPLVPGPFWYTVASGPRSFLGGYPQVMSMVLSQVLLRVVPQPRQGYPTQPGQMHHPHLPARIGVQSYKFYF